MLAVRTPGASQAARYSAACGSAFPFGRQGRLLRSRSISGLFSRSLHSGLQPPCLRFAAAVTGRHARLGSRLLARLCRGRHRRRQTSTRLQGATRTEPYGRLSRIRLVWGFLCQGGITPFLSSSVIPFFCSTRAASILSSRPAYLHRRRAQRRSRTALLQRRRRLVLDQREHGGKLPVIGWFATR